MFLWVVKDFDKSGQHSIRYNTEFDHATKICWSPDSTAYIIQKYNSNSIEVFKVSKKPDGLLGNITPALEFPKVSKC